LTIRGCRSLSAEFRSPAERIATKGLFTATTVLAPICYHAPSKR